MATPPSDDSITLFRLLSDGQWRPYLDVRDALAKTVSPGRALRKYAARAAQAGRVDTDLSEDDKIWLGQKACAQICITSWKERGRGIEQRGRKDSREIRIQPGFRGPGLSNAPDGSVSDAESQGVPEVWVEGSEGSEATTAGAEGVSAEVAGLPGSGDEDWAKPSWVTPPPPEQPLDLVTQGDGVGGSFLLESCGQCGLMIGDRGVHEKWHVAQDAPLLTPEEQEESVTLLGDMLSERLDGFQDGMQHWMAMQFSQLELAMKLWMRSQERWNKPASTPSRNG